IEEGYGLNSDALEKLTQRGVKVLVTVDCGISNSREVEMARNLGMDVVIVDHHEPPAVLPPANAILNPHRADCSFPDKGLCGAGLAFYLIIGLRAHLSKLHWFSSDQVPDIRRCLDIVTLGTIADMVPLKRTNRVLTRRGLVELGTSSRPGVLALKEVAGIPEGEMSVGQVGFRLGPRINAAGRMDAGIKVVEMLTTPSLEVARRIALELDGHNQERQATEARVLSEALEQIEEDASNRERASIVVGREGWHPGVVGIVASRIVERYYRPTVVVGFQDGEGKGSARGIRGFHVVEGFHHCKDLLEKFGGHEYAGGLTVRRENFQLFSDRFEAVARSSLVAEDLIPFLEVDAKIEFSEIDHSLTKEMDRLSPFGIGNPEPVFVTEGVEVSERRDFNGGARFRLRGQGRTLGAVVFGLKGENSNAGSKRKAPMAPHHFDSLLNCGATVDLVYRLTENEWNGTRSVALRIVDVRPSA
ncbi:MAG: single-stranded-DNA-specific exonuclease RecJ, partial [Candidatus Binatia bacterium]|nr:single-stranded-DNA-specific exonuclease RecJ [Candidatus Binatia bacterium]